MSNVKSGASNMTLKDKLKKIKILRFIVKCLRHVLFLIRTRLLPVLSNIKRRIFRILSGRLLPDHKISIKTRHFESTYKFNNPKIFSILVPLYNTPEKYLREMIDSVLKQTYTGLELCLADGSDDKHTYVRDICLEYTKNDTRVVYKKLEKNLGISENTNAAAALATGDYIVLFDHDDLLHPSALFAFMKEIEENNADFLYTDEAVFKKRPSNIFFYHLKPDFSPDYLRTNNYICHLSCFSSELYKKVGGFLDECNGSQDFDMILKLTDSAKKIVHIPRVLYFWRSHPASVAGDLTSKPYVFQSAKNAISFHLARVGLKGVPTDGTALSTYKVEYELTNTPKVSVILPFVNTKKALRSINAVLKSTAYQNLEFVLVGKGAASAEITSDADTKLINAENKSHAALYNIGANNATGEHLVFLGSECVAINDKFIENLLVYSQRSDVGAVGGKTYTKNGTIEQAGLILNPKGTVKRSHHAWFDTSYGYSCRAILVQNLSVLSSEVMMTKKELFLSLGGFDETYEICLYDADYCLKLREKGLLNVFTPYSEAINRNTFYRHASEKDKTTFRTTWQKHLENGDPYYNKNFSLNRLFHIN